MLATLEHSFAIREFPDPKFRDNLKKLN